MGESHSPDLAEPFLSCRASGSESLLSSVWVSKLPWALSTSQRLLKILIKNRSSCCLCFVSLRRRTASFGGGARCPGFDLGGSRPLGPAAVSTCGPLGGLPTPPDHPLPEPRVDGRTGLGTLRTTAGGAEPGRPSSVAFVFS